MKTTTLRSTLMTSLICFAVFSPAAEVKRAKVFLLGGQSNMVGLGQFDV